MPGNCCSGIPWTTCWWTTCPEMWSGPKCCFTVGIQIVDTWIPDFFKIGTVWQLACVYALPCTRTEITKLMGIWIVDYLCPVFKWFVILLSSITGDGLLSGIWMDVKCYTIDHDPTQQLVVVKKGMMPWSLKMDNLSCTMIGTKNDGDEKCCFLVYPNTVKWSGRKVIFSTVGIQTVDFWIPDPFLVLELDWLTISMCVCSALYPD